MIELVERRVVAEMTNRATRKENAHMRDGSDGMRRWTRTSKNCQKFPSGKKRRTQENVGMQAECSFPSSWDTAGTAAQQ